MKLAKFVINAANMYNVVEERWTVAHHLLSLHVLVITLPGDVAVGGFTVKSQSTCTLTAKLVIAPTFARTFVLPRA
jgi:hypothetical protein